VRLPGKHLNRASENISGAAAFLTDPGLVQQRRPRQFVRLVGIDLLEASDTDRWCPPGGSGRYRGTHRSSRIVAQEVLDVMGVAGAVSVKPSPKTTPTWVRTKAGRNLPIGSLSSKNSSPAAARRAPKATER
jgi:hypothetical protein